MKSYPYISKLILYSFLIFGINQSFASFTKGTMVIYKNYPTLIESIQSGNSILGQHEKTGEVGAFPVANTLTGKSQDIVVITIGDSITQATPDQPFKRANGDWVDAGKLQRGDELISLDGIAIIDSIEKKSGNWEINTFEVLGAHTYFAGTENLLAHNYDLEKSIGSEMLWELISLPLLYAKAFLDYVNKNYLFTNRIYTNPIYQPDGSLPKDARVFLHQSPASSGIFTKLPKAINESWVHNTLFIGKLDSNTRVSSVYRIYHASWGSCIEHPLTLSIHPPEHEYTARMLDLVERHPQYITLLDDVSPSTIMDNYSAIAPGLKKKWWVPNDSLINFFGADRCGNCNETISRLTGLPVRPSYVPPATGWKDPARQSALNFRN